MTYPIIENVEIVSMPLYGDYASLDIVSFDVEVSSIEDREFSIIAIYVGRWVPNKSYNRETDPRPGEWQFSNLPSASPVHTAINRAVRANINVRERLWEAITDMMTDDDRKALEPEDDGRSDRDEARFQYQAGIGAIKTYGGKR